MTELLGRALGRSRVSAISPEQHCKLRPLRAALLPQAFSPTGPGTGQRREPGRTARWRLVAEGCLKQRCVEWRLVSEVSGLVQVRKAKRRESRVTRVRGAIASLAPHFHGEEAPRRRGWMFSKLCLFKTLSPSWTLLLPQLPPPGWSQAPRPLRVTPVLWTPPLWGSLPLVSSLLTPLSVHLGSSIPRWPLPTSDQG